MELAIGKRRARKRTSLMATCVLFSKPTPQGTHERVNWHSFKFKSLLCVLSSLNLHMDMPGSASHAYGKRNNYDVVYKVDRAGQSFVRSVQRGHMLKLTVCDHCSLLT
jgi:hypothetical protein